MARMASADGGAPATGAPPLVAVAALRVRFSGVMALSDVSFEIPRDHEGVVGLIGPNGAGKSTLFNVVSGLIKPTEGSVRYDGQEIGRRSADAIMRRGVTRTFQGVMLASGLNVYDNVRLGLHSRRVGRRAMASVVDDALDRVGLRGYEHRFPGSLTYGERKRVELARVLVTAPRLLMLDEPFAGLSALESELLHELIAAATADGVQVVLVEHNMQVVMSVCSRILVLSSGELIADGTPTEIRNAEHVIEAYLGVE